MGHAVVALVIEPWDYGIMYRRDASLSLFHAVNFRPEKTRVLSFIRFGALERGQKVEDGRAGSVRQHRYQRSEAGWLHRDSSGGVQRCPHVV